ncbi:uncharacterized protein PAC_03527 [Phialocephala subalpina]|uniref:Heterokaryon incompatibility domain-containing protein n=1 Tax=Phialocephala subalpina TaxID=576137 RepID=A0A1L7WLK9_9HELO|nr:uncharacterized protein PAC_03527 [Phialocephala subalpina]
MVMILIIIGPSKSGFTLPIGRRQRPVIGSHNAGHETPPKALALATPSSNLIGTFTTFRPAQQIQQSPTSRILVEPWSTRHSTQTPERASLINPPEFCALSYCWGDPKITTGVINGIPVQVTINLESALRHLRANGISVLWVDAEVHTWVGEEDDDFNEAFLSTSMTSDSNMQGGASALVQYLDRPYWTRVRIIQELANARKTTIHCGPHDMDWERLATTVSETNDFVKSSTSVVNFRNLRRFQLTAARLYLLRMMDALLRSRSAVSTDPRDKVFALLNLVYDVGLYLPIPNYKQSIKDLCMSMTLSGEETIRGATYFLASDKTGLNHGPRLGAPSVLQSFGVKQTMGSVSMAADVLKVEGLVLDEVDGICPTYQEVSSGLIAPPSSQSDGDAVAYDPEKTFEATTKTITRYNVIRPQTP